MCMMTHRHNCIWWPRKIKATIWPQVTWPQRDHQVNMYIMRYVLMSWAQWDHALCCSSFLCQAIGKHILVTFDDVTWPHGCNIAKCLCRQSRIVMTDVIHGRVCYYEFFLWKMYIPCYFPPLTYMYEYNDKKKQDIQIIGPYGLFPSCNFQSALSSALALARSQSCTKTMSDRVNQTDLVTWHAKAGGRRLHVWCKKNEKIVMPNFVALRAAIYQKLSGVADISPHSDIITDRYRCVYPAPEHTKLIHLLSFLMLRPMDHGVSVSPWK